MLTSLPASASVIGWIGLNYTPAICFHHVTRRRLGPWRGGFPLRLGASRRVRSRTHFLFERTVRTLCGGHVLRVGASQSGLFLRVAGKGRKAGEAHWRQGVGSWIELKEN
jgi:hypothetical protein